MRGQAPRRVGLEHVVLEHEVARVGPVVRDLAGVVVAHDVGVLRGERALGRVDVPVAEERPARLGPCDEARHAAPGDVAHRVDVVVRAAGVPVRGIVVGPPAAPVQRIGHAHGEPAVTAREAVRTGVRAEVGVEGTVLLHDHDHVADLLDPRVSRSRPGDGLGALGHHQCRGRQPEQDQPTTQGAEPTGEPGRLG